MPELAGLNPFSAMGISGIGFALLIFFLSLLIIGLVGVGIFVWLRNKKLKYKIPLYKMLGSRPFKLGVYKAMDFKIGQSGDKLWYIPRLKKYIPCGTIQTAPNEYPHFEREDGELINFGLNDIDQEMKTAGVKYIDTDMRNQRLAISSLLEQRFQGKQNFWEKYGHLITHVIFYMVVCVCMVVIFYQWGDIVDRTSKLFDKIVAYEEKKCPVGNMGVVPAMIFFIIRGYKKGFRRLKDGSRNFF